MGAYLAWPPGAETTYLYFDVVVTESAELGTQITEHVVEQGPDVTDNVRVALNKITLEVFVTNEPLIEDPQWGSGTTQAYGTLNTYGTAQPNPKPYPELTAQSWFTLPIGVPIINALAAHEEDVTFTPQVGLDPTRGGALNPILLQFSGQFDAVSKTQDALDKLRKGATLLTVYGSKAIYENMVIESFAPVRNEETGTGGSFTIQLKEIRQVSTSIVTAPNTSVPRAQTGGSKGSQSPKPATPQGGQSLLKWLSNLYSGTTPPSPTP